jgi:membrane protein
MHSNIASQFLPILRRTMVRTWDDGFIHAGNLAYLSMLAIFPFFILGAALYQLLGSTADQQALVDAVLSVTPPSVRSSVEPVAKATMEADTGWLLWVGAAVALWTISSLVESIRDILHRAYDAPHERGFWKSRLVSAGLILLAVMLLMGSLFAQVMIGSIEEVVSEWAPNLTGGMADLGLSRAISVLGVFVSLYLLFASLTPQAYRKRPYRKWPGAVATALWWLIVTSLMPPIVSQLITYDLIYGSLAGIMLSLFFFWLVGLGLVMGAEWNASLAHLHGGANRLDEENAV